MMKTRHLGVFLLLVHCLSANVLVQGSQAEDDATTTSSTVMKAPEEDVVLYLPPQGHPDLFFGEHFDDSEGFDRRWTLSTAKKEGQEEALSKYDGEWNLEAAMKDPLVGDRGLVLKSKAKHAAISSLLRKPFVFKEDPLILQYEVNFQKGQDCGGGYIKLLTHDKVFQSKEFNDKTPYTIMFGPDKCGSDAKLHFIFRHINPLNGTITEKHAKKLETKERTTFEEYLKDKRPHLYRLILHPDSTYEISIDYKIVNHGSLLQDFDPPVNPPPEMDDPKDFKPSDWDEVEKIPDPEAKKPEDWDEDQPRHILDDSAIKPEGWLDDEPETIPDPAAEKPDDWDEEMDGEWEAPLVDNPACASAPGCGVWKRPMIDNPLYKGKWRAPLINNPNYRGKWKPRKIKNPDYFHDPEPFKRLSSVGAIGIELWSMSEDIYFDNVLITDNREIADSWASETFDLKVQKLDANDAGIFRRILLYSNRNPWLYAVYVVLVGLPLVLIVTFCCSGGSSSSSSSSSGKGAVQSATDPKKTDAVQDDDEEEEEEEDEEEEDEEEEEEEGGEISNKNDEEPLIERRTSPRKRRARKE